MLYGSIVFGDNVLLAKGRLLNRYASLDYVALWLTLISDNGLDWELKVSLQLLLLIEGRVLSWIELLRHLRM